mgnify:CR=1 FL=1
MERMTQTTKKNRNCLKIALYQPDIPQNTAAIIRLCACFKTRLDIIEPCGFLLNDKKFKRVSMDYINSCEIKSYINDKISEDLRNKTIGIENKESLDILQNILKAYQSIFMKQVIQ